MKLNELYFNTDLLELFIKKLDIQALEGIKVFIFLLTLILLFE